MMGFKIVCDCGCEDVEWLDFSNSWSYGSKWRCSKCKYEEKYFEEGK